MRRVYVTTAIPYVNASPHLGHALELVQTDVLARHRRARGDEVRFLTGTDDNALKNVRAAQEAGVATATFVRRNADRFQALAGPLELSNDDFIRTSTDPRHRPGADLLWRRCLAAGDLYRGRFSGRYCVGCEAFLDDEDDLVDGRCVEHGAVPEAAEEENWFFRLSRYGRALEELIASGRLRILPDERRNEVLAFVRSGLRDVSVSRPVERSGGWGIGVPDDPSQTIYVWFDALASYISALGYGADGAAFRRWWTSSDERIHVIGKGILRFHAVWWPAALLSAGEPLPTTILVHEYVSAGGRKLSKSSGEVIDPVELVEGFGVDAVRWWLVRDVPRLGDADFTVERLVERHDADLSNGLGNVASRIAALGGSSSHTLGADAWRGSVDELAPDLAGRVDDALAHFDLRAASGALVRAGSEVDRLLEATRPWELRRDPERRPVADAVVADAVWACRSIGGELEPFLPSGAARLTESVGGRGRPAFPRIVR